MKTYQKLFLIITFLLIVASCSPSITDNANLIEGIKLKSFQRTLPVFTNEAREWDKDAYLSSVYVAFNNIGTSYINEVFDSPNFPNIEFSISESYDGSISKEHILRSPENNIEIKVGDWKIDSVDLLQYAIKDEEFSQFIKAHQDNACGFIEMEKSDSDPGKLHWRVLARNCDKPLDSIQISIDPISGEIVK